MREYPFELALCAHLEAGGDRLVARQLGGGATRPANRVLDVVAVEPGPAFDRRAAITPAAIPDPVIEADVGVGRFRYWKRAFDRVDVGPRRARAAIERAVELGFLERTRRNGRTYVRQTARYPDWFGRLLAVENKPDLGRPGDLERQLRTDVSLGLVDEVVLATADHVTGAHRNRLPDEVGIWRFSPPDDLEVVREPTRLDPASPGIELVERHPGRTDVAVIDPATKRRRRRQLAERAYASGWRPDALPGCAHADTDDRAPAPGVPHCTYHERIVNPARCGPSCPGFEPAEPPPYDPAAIRASATGWNDDPPGRRRRQVGLDAFRAGSGGGRPGERPG